MSHLIISNLTKTVGEKTLFEDISFTINNQNRAGLIGINGTGNRPFYRLLQDSLRQTLLIGTIRTSFELPT